MRSPVRATLLGLWFCLSSSGVCQSNGTDQSKPPLPEYIQDFFLSDAVRNQERGEFQLTVGLDARHAVGSNTTLKMEYGVTERLQVGLDLPYGMSEEENWENSSRLHRVNFGIQYQVIKSNSPFALSAGIDSGIPISSEEGTEFQRTILAAKSFCSLQIHASAAAILNWERTDLVSCTTLGRFIRFIGFGFRLWSSMAGIFMGRKPFT